jgi:hypothetical protein
MRVDLLTMSPLHHAACSENRQKLTAETLRTQRSQRKIMLCALGGLCASAVKEPHAIFMHHRVRHSP